MPCEPSIADVAMVTSAADPEHSEKVILQTECSIDMLK